MQIIKRYLLLSALAIAAGGLFFFFKIAPNTELSKEQLTLKLLNESIAKNHYRPLKLDDDFSKKLYKHYLSQLDASKRILLQSDLESLESFEESLDDELKSLELGFLNATAEIIKKREGELEAIYKEILAVPFDFNKKEYFETDPDKRDYPKNEAERKETWRLLLKYQALHKYYSLLEKNKDDSLPKTESELEKLAREKVLKNYDEWNKRIAQIDRADRFSMYMNAYMGIYGPHTNYFPPKDKENFDIGFTGRLEGIGARLTVEEGIIKVDEIIPGSPSYKQGELVKGDKIIEVAQGDEEPVDVVDMRLDKAVQLIRGPKGSEVRLTVKKVNGERQIISIIRDVVVIEETYAKSAIISRKDSDKKYGYIHLPKFYADFQRKPNGRNCSVDVQKEVRKLKNDGVNGVVLDLRNNGGGSLMDVVSMVGLFIQDGPVVLVDEPGGVASQLNDPDPGIEFTQPLVVLVNKFSASASEIFAAAIQDYGRGVVMGSSSTFGKGTVQRFHDLNVLLMRNDPMGHVKQTTHKFYRINGGSTQLKGVSSDILLPDIYEGMDIGEKEYEFAMEWDKIKPVNYKSYKNFDLKKLQKESQDRIDTNSVFQHIISHGKLLQEGLNETKQLLTIDALIKEKKEVEESSKKLNELKKRVIADMVVNEISSETGSEQSDATKKFLERIVKDQQIYEALLTISEMK